jgi:hypothetical protein
MWLKFVDQYCAQVKYILKVDDDVFVNIFGVISILETSQPTNSIMCSVSYDEPVVRDPQSKWFV